jgi:CheY-like chemotaxis protein
VARFSIGGEFIPSSIERTSERLAHGFRQDDVVGQIDETSFVIALQRTGRRLSTPRLEEVLFGLDLPPDACRVGVVEFPNDGSTGAILIASAQQAVERARIADRPPLVSVDWQADEVNAPDIAVVDSDRGLTSVMSHALVRRGHSVVVHNDGLTAAAHLCGETALGLPRVVVLDLYVNGIDGLQVLRRLRDAGTAGRFHIILLTAQPRETDLIDALKLGICEYISKPFSAAVLQHRIRAAMAGAGKQ